MQTPQTNPAWAELIQLVPILALAAPFVLRGEVDVAAAGPMFGVAALLTVPVFLLLRARSLTLNPILVGTALWLWSGAVAFGLPIVPLAELYAQTQAAGLFVCALGIGVVATFASDAGYIGCRHPDRGWIRRASLALLGLTVAVVAWSLWMRHDVRLGGGLPFIVLNMARRIGIARA